MPKRNDAERRMQRITGALMRSSNPNERLLGGVADALSKIRQDEDNRLCDVCKLPKRECDILNSDAGSGGEPHVFSPMSAQKQLAHDPEYVMRHSHFDKHPPDCKLRPEVCQATAGGR